MTARTVSDADPMIIDAAFDPKPAKPVKSDTNAMMAGADMYRRMQARPQKSATAYIIGGAAAIALIGGGAYFASHQLHARTDHMIQTASLSAINSDQQAQASSAQAQAAQKSAQTSADTAQAKTVAQTGAPPAAATDTSPTPARTVTRTHETVVHRTTVARQTQPSAPSASAAAPGVDASALTAPPPPVTATQPAPTPTVPAPAATPAPAPDPTPPPATTPPQ